MSEVKKTAHPIGIVVRRTGLKPELIRAWERRHQAIEPRRSTGKHRLYSEEDIERLDLLRRVTATGRPIGKVARLPTVALRELATRSELTPGRTAVETIPSPVRSRRDSFLSRGAVRHYGIASEHLSPDGTLLLDDINTIRELALVISERRRHEEPPRDWIRAAHLNALGMTQEFWQRTIRSYLAERDPATLRAAFDWLVQGFGHRAVDQALAAFRNHFSPAGTVDGEPPELTLEKTLRLWLANNNPAFEPLRDLFDDRPLESAARYGRLMTSLESFFRGCPGYGPQDESLFAILRAPALAAPASLADQLRSLIDVEERIARFHLDQLRTGLDVLLEEDKPVFAPGPPPAAEVGAYATIQEKKLSVDRPWMTDAVMVVKHLLVWLDQLSRQHEREIRRLDEIPEDALRALVEQGFNVLWLVGLWERSSASAHLKACAENTDDVAASAYALAGYAVAAELGGEEAFSVLERRAKRCGLRLACDFVPNHMGIDAPWVVEYPERFIQTTEPPYPSYSFTGEDLSSDPRVGIFLEDHYADQTDAAVVFRRLDHRTGEESFLYHGNDGTSLPWNDTAQLDYLRADVREAMLDKLVELARRFRVIRIDAAMTLVKQHFQRLWYPAPGQGGAVPSRAERGLAEEVFETAMPEELWREATQRVAREAPETLLLAEGFWMMESYMVSALGLHRVYNSAFMHFLRDEDNEGLDNWLRDALTFDRRVLGRCANFLTTPDEDSAASQFGHGDKYFGLCVLLAAMPGLPLFGHGQVEGLAEKYGMEYRRAREDEEVNEAVVARHEREVFPLLQRRHLFSGTEHFRLYEVTSNGEPCKDVIAFSNGNGEERALVLFHNRDAEVSIRVGSAAPYQEGDGEQLNETLAESFGIEGNGVWHCVDARNGESRELTFQDLNGALDFKLGAYESVVLWSGSGCQR